MNGNRKLGPVEAVRLMAGRIGRAHGPKTAKAFSAGVAIGSPGLAGEVFVARPGKFGPKKKDAARPIQEAEHSLFSPRVPPVQAVE